MWHRMTTTVHQRSNGVREVTTQRLHAEYEREHNGVLELRTGDHRRIVDEGRLVDWEAVEHREGEALVLVGETYMIEIIYEWLRRCTLQCMGVGSVVNVRGCCDVCGK